MKHDNMRRINENQSVYSVEVGESMDDKLRHAKFSDFLNRDSLCREIPQHTMIFVEFLISYLNGSLYAALLSALNKDDDTLNTLQENINDCLVDIKKMQKSFYHDGHHMFSAALGYSNDTRAN